MVEFLLPALVSLNKQFLVKPDSIILSVNKYQVGGCSRNPSFKLFYLSVFQVRAQFCCRTHTKHQKLPAGGPVQEPHHPK